MELFRDGLFHLQHHLGIGEDRVRGADDLGPRALELVVKDARSPSGVGLDQDVMSVDHQLAHARRGYGDPVLVVLQLFGDPYDHQSY